VTQLLISRVLMIATFQSLGLAGFPVSVTDDSGVKFTMLSAPKRLIATMPSLLSVFVGIALSFALLLIRIGAVNIATVRSDIVQDRPIMSIMLTRGLAAVVLVTLPLQYVDPVKYPEVGAIFRQLSPIYINIAIVVILTTSAIATIGIPILRRRTQKTSKSKTELDQ